MGDAVARNLLAAGLAAPALYGATVIIGGFATPGYSHLAQPVSALFETGAPHALSVSLAFIAYNLLLMAFAAGLLRALAAHPAASRLVPAIIALNGLFGLAIELAPMDPVGAPATPAGVVHLVLAGLLVLTTAGAMAAALATRHATPVYAALARMTLVLLVILLVTGAWAAIAANRSLPMLGLAQRLTIGSYLLWLVLLAARFLRKRS